MNVPFSRSVISILKLANMLRKKVNMWRKMDYRNDDIIIIIRSGKQNKTMLLVNNFANTKGD